MSYVFLIFSILCEVIGTSALKASNGFTNLKSSLLAAGAYGLCFYFLSLTLKALPVGQVYASWAGLGILLITLAGIFLFGEIPDMAAIIGMGLIIAGVIILNVVSKNAVH